MNNIMQQDRAEKKIINGRYQLSQCVFTHHSGSLYLAVDNQQPGADHYVLIHLFPKRSIGYEELVELFSSLQQGGDAHGGKINEVDGCQLLSVLDCGWLGMSAYFVLTVPDMHSANQLKPLQQNSPGQLYQQAVALSDDLLQQGAIGKGLTLPAFVVQSDAIYLLPTALSDQFQQLQREAELLHVRRTNNPVRAGRLLPVLGWGAMTVALAGGGGYGYYLLQQGEGDGSATTILITADAQREAAAGAVAAQIEQKPTVKPDVNEPGSPVGGQEVMETTAQNKSQEKVFADVKEKEDASEAFPIASIKSNAESDTMHEQRNVTSSPNIEPMVVANPVILETSQPIVRHSEPVPPEPVPVKPAPLSSSANELNGQEALPVTTIMPASINIAQAAKEAAAKEAAAKEAAAKEAAAKEAAAKEAAAKEAAAKEAAEKEAAEKEAAEKEAAEKEAAEKDNDAVKDEEKDGDKKAAEEDNKPDVKKKSGSTEPTTAGLTKDELVQQAYKAIAADKLSEEAGKGAVYYIRLLKRLDRTNPQIKHLARKVASIYHEKMRRAIKRKHKLSARRLLWVSGRLIKEFNLAQMNKAHAVLKHRIEDEFLK